MKESRRKIFDAGAKLAAFLLACVLVFILVEGVSSTIISVVQLMREPPLSSPSTYHATLGWTSTPNTFEPHFYGPGKYVRTNSRGFRNDGEIRDEEPSGKLRIVCSGDSFTYGQGVANDRTWCHLLSELDSRIETVNLGQPGYGIDQIYMRYLNDGVNLQHSVHIFAFVDGDLDRMGRLDQHLHGKPVLRLENGDLVTDHIPVPRFKWWLSRAVERAEFRSIGLAQRIAARLGREDSGRSSKIDTIGPVAMRVFENVIEQGDRDDVIPLLVLLPTENIISADSRWYQWVKANPAARDMPFLDLTPAMRAIPSPVLDSYFISQSLPAGGHYTEAGNQWAARSIYEYLMSDAHVRSALSEIEPAPGRE